MRSDRECNYRVFDHLSQQEFVDLCNGLLLRVISPGVMPFGAKGRDAKRDGIFRGKSDYLELEGFWIFRNKFHKVSEQGIKQARSRVKSELVKELEEVVELYGSEVNNFIFLTNVTFTAAMCSWFEQKVVAEYRNDTLRHIEYWDGHKVFFFLQQYPELYDRYIRDRAAAIEKKVDELPAQLERVARKSIVYQRPPAGIPFQAPPLPPHFVPRPEVSDSLKAHLLAEETATPGVLVVSAIYGMGGIGKTTMAAALAHDPEVQARFPDGVLWATLGQQPDLLSIMSDWIITALHDYDYKPTTVEAASTHLRTLLRDKACLLVVDDAWQADHVRPFLVDAPGCEVLITTRDAALARQARARLCDLDVMTEEQALALFQARLGPLDSDREQAAALARELGYLPLALELAGAQVEAGFSWIELLDAFRQAQTDLAALDLDEATYRNESLRLSFCLSLEELSSDDQNAFAWLGVLSEDARLNPAMAATLWNQSEADAHRRLRRLRDRALLKFIGDERYTIHDLLHDEAKLRLVERMSLSEAHIALLERYRARCMGKEPLRPLWHTLPDDGYIHAHLTWHLEQAGREDELQALLREETAEGQNGWYQARDRLGQTAGYLEDVVRAWRRAEAAGDVGMQVRCALCRSSVASLSANISAVLLDDGIWSPLSRAGIDSGAGQTGGEGAGESLECAGAGARRLPASPTGGGLSGDAGDQE
jgi:hypothetical protein